MDTIEEINRRHDIIMDSVETFLEDVEAKTEEADLRSEDAIFEYDDNHNSNTMLSKKFMGVLKRGVKNAKEEVGKFNDEEDELLIKLSALTDEQSSEIRKKMNENIFQAQASGEKEIRVVYLTQGANLANFGSLSAVSASILGRKHSFCSIFLDLQNHPVELFQFRYISYDFIKFWQTSGPL